MKVKCDRCKHYTWNKPVKEMKHNVMCHRLLNKASKELNSNNGDCKYYEEYIGYEGTCSACNNIKAILTKGKEEGEYIIIYTCTVTGKQTQLISDQTECKDYVDINYMDKEEE